jgi:alkanesulfonate monooxygenase SsuD/methylene tetrahydromethanopterin reductase-like flavin-dependent oxidoreductase (luciferase family)
VLFGAHLPIAGWGGARPAASTVIECAEAAEALGYTTLCANDHIVFSVPWIDGLVALGAAAARTRSIQLMTTASLLVVRGPAALGSAAVALAHLSGDRVTICLTAGSTILDYEAVGIPFDERWPRFEAAISSFRSYLEQAGMRLPVWIASWGSAAGLRRVARHGDGWLASGYHATPEHFASCLSYLRSHLQGGRKDQNAFPNAVATMYTYLTDDPAEARSVLGMLVSPRHAPSDLRDRSLIGTAQECIERLRGLEAAGVQQVFIWPVVDEVRQLRRFVEEVASALMQRPPAVAEPATWHPGVP